MSVETGLQIINVLVIPLVLWVLNTIRNETRLLITESINTLNDRINSKLESLYNKIDNEYVCREVWDISRQQHSEKLSQIERRIDTIGQNVHGYNGTVMKLVEKLTVIEIERANGKERKG